MKKHLFIMMAFLCSGFSRAQLAPGSHAYDFTVTDQFGIQHNLYSYLDQGFTVIFCIDATWNGPGWLYHQSGTLNQLYTEHGPAGVFGVNANTTNDVIVIWMDGDESTSDITLTGQSGTNSQGNWLLNPNTGEPLNYPVCNPNGSELSDIFTNYAVAYFPLIYEICPDRSVKKLDPSWNGSGFTNNSAEVYSAINCTHPTLPFDIDFVSSYIGANSACGSLDLGTLWIKNYGINVLNSFTIQISGSALSSPINIPWNGNLESLEVLNIDLGSALISQSGEIGITVINDENPNNSTIVQNVSKITTPSTTKVKIRIQFDEYPEECSWTIKNDLGITINGKDYSTNTPADLSTVEEIVDLPSLGCYYFVINDAYGDGLHGSQWTTSGNTGNDGNISVTTLNAANNDYSTIWNYNGSSDYSSITFAINASLTPSAAGTGSGNSQIGCTNPQACNYNASATQDNGSCILPQTEICDSLDNNCNGSIDENCISTNFNTFTCESAVSLDNQTYIYPDTTLNFSTGILNSYYEQGIFINPPSDAGIIDPAYSGYVLSTFTLQSITYNNGIPISELGLSATCNPSNCTYPPNQLNCITVSGQPSQAGAFNIELNIVVTALVFGLPVPIELTLTGYTLIILNELPSTDLGCTNPQACNYNPTATQDNGSCLIIGTPCNDNNNNTYNDIIDSNCTCFGTSQNIGCTNPQACNFNPSANQDNGSCLVIGSTCNDGNNATVNDIVGSSCTCAGTPTDLNGNNENTYQGLFYQAVARNADGTPMANQNISIRFSLHQSTANGTLEYQEVQNVSSNAMGLFTTFFGTGQAVIGNFSNIQWGVNAKYLQVEMDINGWQTIGTQQLAAVPYAIRAKEVDAGGLKLQSPNGNCYILQVNNNGSLSTLQVPCD